jgi:hypothetical protein
MQYPHAKSFQNNPFKWFAYPYIIVVPMFTTTLTQLQRSHDFQSSILVVDLENEVKVYSG